MGYQSGMLDKRIGIWTVDRDNMDGKSGRGSGGVKYKCAGCVWGSLKFTRGLKPLREGALESYDVVMVRMRWNDIVDKDSRLTCEGKTYQILQFQSDRRDNIVQITAQQTTEKLDQL